MGWLGPQLESMGEAIATHSYDWNPFSGRDTSNGPASNGGQNAGNLGSGLSAMNQNHSEDNSFDDAIMFMMPEPPVRDEPSSALLSATLTADSLGYCNADLHDGRGRHASLPASQQFSHNSRMNSSYPSSSIVPPSSQFLHNSSHMNGPSAMMAENQAGKSTMMRASSSGLSLSQLGSNEDPHTEDAWWPSTSSIMGEANVENLHQPRFDERTAAQTQADQLKRRKVSTEQPHFAFAGGFANTGESEYHRHQHQNNHYVHNNQNSIKDLQQQQQLHHDVGTLGGSSERGQGPSLHKASVSSMSLSSVASATSTPSSLTSSSPLSTVTSSLGSVSTTSSHYTSSMSSPTDPSSISTSSHSELAKTLTSGSNPSPSSASSSTNSSGQSSTTTSSAASALNTGRWSDKEHQLFLQGLKLHGRNWKAIAEHVKSRSHVQIRTHAQKYFIKEQKSGATNISISDASESNSILKSNRGNGKTSIKTKTTGTPKSVILKSSAGVSSSKRAVSGHMVNHIERAMELPKLESAPSSMLRYMEDVQNGTSKGGRIEAYLRDSENQRLGKPNSTVLPTSSSPSRLSLADNNSNNSEIRMLSKADLGPVAHLECASPNEHMQDLFLNNEVSPRQEMPQDSQADHDMIDPDIFEDAMDYIEPMDHTQSTVFQTHHEIPQSNNQHGLHRIDSQHAVRNIDNNNNNLDTRSSYHHQVLAPHEEPSSSQELMYLLSSDPTDNAPDVSVPLNSEPHMETHVVDDSFDILL